MCARAIFWELCICLKRCGELGAVVLAAALDFGELGEDIATSGHEGGDGLALGVKAKAAASLLVGRDSVVSNASVHKTMIARISIG